MIEQEKCVWCAGSGMVYDGDLCPSGCASREKFLSAEPFPHLSLDSAIFFLHLTFKSDPFRLSRDLLRRASAEFDQPAPDHWVRYNGPAEKLKRTFNRLELMPPACREVFDRLLSQETVQTVERITGMRGLQPDPTLYGGGLHVTEPGGFLGLHLDNELHPQTGLARRLNLIVYLTEDWRPEWGGELELQGPVPGVDPTRIAPSFGRAVLFETANHNYHGHPAPLACPPDVCRKSIAVFYWSEPRRRAEFLGGR